MTTTPLRLLHAPGRTPAERRAELRIAAVLLRRRAALGSGRVTISAPLAERLADLCETVAGAPAARRRD